MARRQFIVKKWFQLKIALLVILVGFVCANLTGTLIYGILRGTLGTRTLLKIFGVHNLTDIMLPLILGVQLIGLALVAVIAIYFSHKIAGPIYRLEQLSKVIGTGDLSVRVKVRQDDEFQELADEMDHMVASLREKVQALRIPVENLVETIDYLEEQANINPAYTSFDAVRLAMLKKTVEEIRETLAEFRTEPEPKNEEPVQESEGAVVVSEKGSEPVPSVTT